MKRRHARIIIIIFLLAIFTISVISLVDSDKAISEKESRTLAQKPKLTVKSIVDGSYVRDFESYYSDQFPFRDWLLNLNFKVSSLLSIKTNDDVSLIGGGQGSDFDENTDIFNPPPTQNIEPTKTPSPTITTATTNTSSITGIVTTPSPTKEVTSTPRITPTLEPEASYEKDKKFLRLGDRILEIYGSSLFCMGKPRGINKHKCQCKIINFYIIKNVFANNSIFLYN